MINSTLIEQQWPLTGTELKTSLANSSRHVWHIGSAEGDYILKAADESKDSPAIERDTAIFTFLGQHNFPAPALILTKDGKSFIEHDGRYWYMLSYVSGERPVPTPETFRRLGELTAQLHGLEGYTVTTSFTFAKEIDLMRERATKQHVPVIATWLRVHTA